MSTDARPGTRRRAAAAATLATLGALAAGVLLGPAQPGSLAAPAAPASPAVLVSPVAAPAAPAAPPVPRAVAALGAATTQAVVVDAPAARSTTATITAWERRGGTWVVAREPVPGHLGAAGIGPSSESAERTPAGTFGITRAFGRAADPGTTLPYDRVGADDWWVSDTASPQYNTRQTCRPGTCPFDEKASENLRAAGPAYDHAIVIDANTDPVRPGAGSAYFLHIGDAPTAGCVAVARTEVVGLLRWLRPDANPVISLGVGA